MRFELDRTSGAIEPSLLIFATSPELSAASNTASMYTAPIMGALPPPEGA